MEREQKTVDEIIDALPRDEKTVVRRLRALVLECLPSVLEKNSYGVPFYRRKRMICFIWPPSIVWGPPRETIADKGVTLGFCQGNRMTNDEGLLLAEGRKQVYCMYFKNPGEIDDQAIRALLYEADEIDRTFQQKKAKARGARTPKKKK